MNVLYVLMLLWGAGFLVCFGAFAVHLYRSEGSPTPPVGRVPAPRIALPTGPEKSDAVPSPPTRSSARRRRTVPPSDPRSLGGIVASGWRLK